MGVVLIFPGFCWSRADMPVDMRVGKAQRRWFQVPIDGVQGLGRLQGIVSLRSKIVLFVRDQESRGVSGRSSDVGLSL